jgi:phosphoribosylanthranilate isomerase
MTVKVKICGLTKEASLEVALACGADMVGIVFFPPSPRNVTASLAGTLAARARGRAKIVALMVDPSDAAVERAVAAAAPDLIQLHGAETPQRVAAIRRRWGPVIKAVAVATSDDVARALAYGEAADMILFDARAPADSSRPGGNGAAFDWRTLAGTGAAPFVLSGGLTPDNVAAAIRVTGAAVVDVSSGVERRPGVKDDELIRRFIHAAKGV